MFLGGLLVDQVSVVTMQTVSGELLQPELFPWWQIFSFFAIRSVSTVTIAVKSGKNYNLLDGDLGSGESGFPPHACCLPNLAVKHSKDASCTAIQLLACAIFRQSNIYLDSHSSLKGVYPPPVKEAPIEERCEATHKGSSATRGWQKYNFRARWSANLKPHFDVAMLNCRIKL